MMKIAIWGYGKYGRRMFESLTRFCSEEYEVVRVYDKDFQKLKSTEGEYCLQIHNPEELSNDYRNRLFEKVLVCIFNHGASKEPQKLLQENSIPELHLGSPEDFYPVASFEQGKKPFEIIQEQYNFFVIKNLYGAKANYESFDRLYLFDDEGRVVKEHKDNYNSGYFELCDYPFVFRHSKVEKTFLKGQYCVLAKQYSGNYWHFTYNSLDIIWILEKAGYQGKYVVPDAGFVSELLQLLDVPPERIISLRYFEHNKIYVFEEVFYIVCVMPDNEKQVYGTPVLFEAAEYIKKKLPVDPSLPKKIYVKRIGKRKLIGADVLIAKYGFKTIIPENYSLREQMTLFFNAEIIFCVHGANSTNCLYMRKDTVFIEVFSSYWMKQYSLYALAAERVNYLPISSLETVLITKEGYSRDFELPEVLLRMTIKNAFLIYQAQHGTILNL